MDMTLGDTQLILRECRREGCTVEQTAYILATAKWETAHTMHPVVEAYWLSEDWRSKNLRYYPWHGRGYVQLTWRENYVKAGNELNVKLTDNPQLALQPDIAAKILVAGMLEGWFTGRALGDYVGNNQVDYRGARRVVNGTDQADKIAAIARDYEMALLESGAEAQEPVSHPDPAERPASPLAGLLSRIFGSM